MNKKSSKYLCEEFIGFITTTQENFDKPEEDLIGMLYYSSLDNLQYEIYEIKDHEFNSLLKRYIIWKIGELSDACDKFEDAEKEYDKFIQQLIDKDCYELDSLDWDNLNSLITEYNLYRQDYITLSLSSSDYCTLILEDTFIDSIKAFSKVGFLEYTEEEHSLKVRKGQKLRQICKAARQDIKHIFSLQEKWKAKQMQLA